MTQHTNTTGRSTDRPRNNAYLTPTERGTTDTDPHGHRASAVNECPQPESMRKVCFVFIETDLYDWVRLKCAETGFSMSTVVRNQLRLAYKYRRAIADAERAPERFRTTGRNNGL